MSPAPSETVWEHGRFDGRAGPGKLLFGRMYEDSRIELEAFAGAGRVFSIASAGCTAMALAPHHEVVAVDINPVQLAYAQSQFAGSPGVQGAAERFMAFGRVLGPLVGWWPARVQSFLALADPEQQRIYWHQHLDTRRFRSAVDAVFSVTALRSVYAPDFLDFLPVRLGAVMRGRLQRCISCHPNRSNPYLRALLAGELAESSPYSGRVQLVHSDAADFLERQPAGSFDGFALSNILDGAAATYRRRLFAAVKRAGSERSMVVLRSFAEPAPSLATNRAANDRSALWGIVDVRPAASLA